MSAKAVRLVDLNPGWLSHGGEGYTNAAGEPIPERERIGVTCDCPCGGVCGQRPAWLFTNPVDGGPALEGTTWTRTGTTFETLSLDPSLQRMGGCSWHGHLKNGVLEPC